MNYIGKTYLCIGILSIASAILIVFFICPIVSAILDKSAELVEAKRKLASIDLLIESFSDFEKGYNYYEESLLEMEELLTGESAVDPEIPINFITFFKQEAEDLALILKVNPVETKETDSFWTFLDFRIEGAGEYGNFRRFLKKVEFGSWFVETKSLSVRKEEAAGYSGEQGDLSGKNLVQFDLIIRVYAQEKN